MSHRSTPEKELEVQLELYLGIGTFGEVGFWWSWWILFAFKSLKMVRNGTKKVQKVFFVIFGVFEFFFKFFGFSVKMTFLDFLLMIIHSWSKNLSKVHEKWPISFQIFLLNFSPKSICGTTYAHQVPPTHKWAKMA